MDMPRYLAEIEHAASSIIDIVWADHSMLIQLEVEAEKLRREMEDGYRRAEALSRDAETPEDVMAATGGHWDTYFEADKEHHQKRDELADACALMSIKGFSRGSLSGSLLQYGKQGISIVHKKLAACPAGRAIGSQDLKDVIWQGRNQALHWEAGSVHSPVEACFQALARDQGAQFADYNSKNLAFDVVELLGWRSWNDFRADMMTLA